MCESYVGMELWLVLIQFGNKNQQGSHSSPFYEYPTFRGIKNLKFFRISIYGFMPLVLDLLF